MTKLSFQIYSARNFQPWEDTYAKLGKAGYSAIEGFGPVYGAMDKAAGEALKTTLAANGLAMPTGHFSIVDLETRNADVLEFSAAAGVENIYCPYLLPEQRPADFDGWRAFGARLATVGEAVKAAGFGFGWHNHDFEFQTFDNGKTVLDAIFEGGPDLAWEADIAWIVRGSADPLEYVEKYADRITAVHVKDIAPKGENLDEDGWADPGHGTLAWPELISAIREKTGARHFVVEHDNPSDIDRLINQAMASFKSW